MNISQLGVKPYHGRILEKKIAPVFAKYDMEFRCEMVDTVPCQALWLCWHVHMMCVCVKHDYHAPGHASKVRNWHNLMPNVATLKNAYRDRPAKRRAQRDILSEDDEENSENPKKVPQSFTFLRREGWQLLCLSLFMLCNCSIVLELPIFDSWPCQLCRAISNWMIMFHADFVKKAVQRMCLP